MVEIKNIGAKYSGKYLVTATTHVYNPSEGYTTLFSINGKRPANLLALLDDEGGGARAEDLGSNIVIGIVTDNKDPDKNQGRVKVKYPWNTEDAHQRLGAPRVPDGRAMGAGSSSCRKWTTRCWSPSSTATSAGLTSSAPCGTAWTPPVEGNDVAVVDNKVVHRIIKTRIGHTILLDDTDEKGEMKMTTKSGHFLTLNDRDKNITAQDQRRPQGPAGRPEQARSSSWTSPATTSITIMIPTPTTSSASAWATSRSRPRARSSIQGQQGIKMSTPMQFETTADAGLTMTTSAQMQLKAEATMDVEATGPTTIKGAIVQIN